uniref:ISXO2-like transposase domain-containing protein n=1 Tax=Panagrolaimus superbus TaxID=310955 RepID=A0A914Y5T1_9BILA
MDELRQINNREFYKILNKSPDEFEEFLINLDLLPGKTKTCLACGGTMNLRDRGKKGLTYRCTTYRCRKEIFELSYLWAHHQADVKNVSRNVKNVDGSSIADVTISDWKNFFRDLCHEYFKSHPIIIGGPGVVVHIDETVITKRKYHRGRLPSEEWWFFGGIEVVSGRAFIVPVKRRNRETLIPLIQKHIAPGTVIHSDCWAAYSTISQLPQGYIHRRSLAKI